MGLHEQPGHACGNRRPCQHRHMLALLSSRGYRVVPVDNSDAGLDLSQRLRFDVAFCSLHAPGLNWVELSERMQSRVGAFVLLSDGYDAELTADFEGENLFVLPKPVQELLMAGDIEMGHARSLLALEAADQILIANQVIAKGLSVRETEKLVNHHLRPHENGPKVKPETDRDVLRLQEELSDKIGAVVNIKANKKGIGTLTIEFASLDQLDGLINRIGG